MAKLKVAPLERAYEIDLASRLIRLGARLQVLTQETSLSIDQLSRLYIDIHGRSAPKGMLPFSEDWFLPWKANLHASLCYTAFVALDGQNLSDAERLVRAYTVYTQSDLAKAARPTNKSENFFLSLTRAWMLIRLIERAGSLALVPCRTCSIPFLVRNYTPEQTHVCGICNPPARSIKSIYSNPIAKALQAHSHHETRTAKKRAAA